MLSDALPLLRLFPMCVALTFIALQFSQIFYGNPQLMNLIRHYGRSDEQALKTYADQAYRRITSGGEAVAVAPPYQGPMPMHYQEPAIPPPYAEVPYPQMPPEFYDERRVPPGYSGPIPHPQQRHHAVVRKSSLEIF